MVFRMASEYLDVEEAAQLLGVSKRHVARLGSIGELRYIGRGMVERASVTEYLREREFSRSRAWSADTAWAAVALLSGLRVDWLGQVQTSRLRSRLRQIAENADGAREMVGRTRNRATVRTYESHDFLVSRMREELVVVSRRRLGLADARDDQIDGYINGRKLVELEKRYGLQTFARGSMVIRSTLFDIRTIERIASEGNGALAALDAAGTTDARERGVGARALTTYLEEFAGARSHG